MNSKKALIPIAVLLLTVISFYSMINTNMKTANEYKSVLDTARDYASQGIVDDAVKYFKKALEYKMDDDIYIEYVNVYVDNGQEKKALRVAEEMVKEINDSSKVYECLLDRYIALKDYESCFSLDDEASKKHLKSDGFSSKMAEIEYTYAQDYQIYSEVKAFSGGYAAVKSGELFGIIDETGNRVLSKAYSNAGYFSYYTNKNNKEDSGFIIPVSEEDGIWKYISDTGNKKIEIDDSLKFNTLGLYIDNGLTAASIDGKYSYYNADFEKQFGDYLYAGAFNNGRAAVQLSENEWFIINEKGETLNSTPFVDIVLDEKEIAFRNERAFVLIDNYYYMVDTEGKIIGEQKYTSARPFLSVQDNDKSDALAAVCLNGKWGFVDKSGKLIIEPQFMDARSFSNSFAAVEMNGKWGFVSSDGSIVIDFTFDNVKDFNSKGCVFVEMNSRWSLIKLFRYNH